MMREFKPVESFFTLYLTSPPVNLSTDDVSLLKFLTQEYYRHKTKDFQFEIIYKNSLQNATF